jgi:flagellar M-ring protein FliF
VFGAIRPAIKAAGAGQAAASQKGKLNAVVDDAQELPAFDDAGLVLGPDGQPLAALESPGADRRLESARALARGNPQAMANVVRGWMNN